MNETVLIADSHAERARKVAVACGAYGIEVHRVTHGAAALEYALAEKPAAMVAQVELPLIDGVRLAEILQTNPHTRSLGVLFVGDGEGAPSHPGARRASVIPGHADPDTIARFIEALIQKRRPEQLPPAVGAAPSVEGKLAQIALSELIDLFLVNGKTGVIEVQRSGGRRAESGRIQLREGHVVHARCGAVAGEKAFYRMLEWRDGSFAFREDVAAEPESIERPTRALLREGRRQSEEWARSGQDLPSPRARVALCIARSSLPNQLHPLTQEVLLLIEKSGSVKDVLDRSAYPDYQVLRTLQTLERRGLIELGSSARTPGASGSLFAPALASRLRDWLDQGLTRDTAAVDAKVIVIASDPDAQRALRQLAARLPGAEETPADSVPGVWPVLRIPVDDEIGLEWFEVPAAARFAPIWPLAVHGALATLFVHTRPVEVSSDVLRPAIDRVGALPRARGFHVLLDADAGAAREGAEWLRRSLGLRDDRSALALSAHAERAIPVLRDLLVQLIP